MVARRKRMHKKLPFRKIVPNMITSGNMLCGMLSIVLTFHGQYVPAALLVYIAMVFDYLDGDMARRLGGSSEFGMELDSLADVVSFGVAPAVLLYSVYLQGFWSVTGALVAAFFALCGALRLARFNVHHVSGSFQGLPIPAAGHFVVSFVFAGIALPAWLMSLVTVGTGLLMISSVPFGNLKTLKKGNLNKVRAFALLGVAFTLVAVLRQSALLAGISIYIASGFLHFDWGKWLSLDSESEDYLEHRNT